jgi:lipid-A-disaccharide synthase
MPPAEAAPIMIVAGETSGDLHGATLCRALRDLAPTRRLIGMGGERMAAAGLERLADVTRAAVIGGTEALGPIPTLLRAWRRLKTVLTKGPRPGALVLIDFPEFNMRLARVARRVGVPVVYFIPPQVWAWRPWRARALARRVSLVLAVFPFEVALYRAVGARVEFVGHPILDVLAHAPTREEARRRLGLDPGATVIGLLPGSRAQEVASTLPVLHDAARRIAAERRWRPCPAAPDRIPSPCCATRRPRSRSFAATPMRSCARPICCSSTRERRPWRPRCSARRWWCATGSRG